MPPHSGIMNKSARIFFTLLLAVFILSGCIRKQAPSQYGKAIGSSGGSLSDTGDFDRDIIPASDGDWSLEGELRPRGPNDGIAGDKYKGIFTMVEGVLPSIYFGYDSYSVAASERSKLQQAANYLEKNPGYHLLVEGHCDWYGTTEYNLALGDRRANSISDYFGTLGITPLRIETLSKGSLESVGGLSKSQSSQDRRADLIILKK
jgi:peptidoglycan-associated lipoprotein